MHVRNAEQGLLPARHWGRHVGRRAYLDRVVSAVRRRINGSSMGAVPWEPPGIRVLGSYSVTLAVVASRLSICLRCLYPFYTESPP